MIETKLIRYTTAPEAYDGFGTVTLAHCVACDTRSRDKVMRRVGIAPEHLSWQEQRYGSGMHCCMTEEQFGKLLASGLFQTTPESE